MCTAPGNIAWISDDATIDRIDGVIWEDERFFLLDAARLVRQLKGVIVKM